jgi:hypothetical protein
LRTLFNCVSYPGISSVPTTVSDPHVSVAVPGIPPYTYGIITSDSAPESILFVDTEFDLERVKWLLNEYRRANFGLLSHREIWMRNRCLIENGTSMDSKSFRQETAKTLLFRVEIEFGA